MKAPRHLLGIRGMTKQDALHLLDAAGSFAELNRRDIKKGPALRGKTVINLFLEPSTRTRSSFELAGKRLSAEVINISGKESSVNKGETLLDTALTLESMACDVLVIRHPSSGAPHQLAALLPNVPIVNAGDGLHEHPTQALLDAFTIREHLGRIEGLKIAYVGDVLRSRVARSAILLSELLGIELRLIAPSTLASKEYYPKNVVVTDDIEAGLDGVDAIVSLRMKHEYLSDHFVPNLDEYTRKFYISEKLIQRTAPNAVVLAPGPYIRGTEIDSPVIDGPRSLYKQQVFNGVSLRMAVLFDLCFSGEVFAEDMVV